MILETWTDEILGSRLAESRDKRRRGGAEKQRDKEKEAHNQEY
jgi:hypothetical protein